jgi:hypothetical protein
VGGATGDDDEARPVAVLVGASGAGKSTAAAALGPALGDELVVIEIADGGVRASGTPWWNGRPAGRAVALVGRLAKDPAGRVEGLGGSRALRALAPHLVRYVVDDETDRAAFARLGALCAAVPVVALGCPVGAGYVPFLRRALDEAAPRAEGARR